MQKTIYVLFEESGRVREAFRALGYPALSIDTLPSRREGPHIQADIWQDGILSLIEAEASAIICFPPCTHLCVSGNRHHAGTKRREIALDNIRTLMKLQVPHMAIENPVGVISTQIRKPDQTIQPWMFGHPESKRTCLWLRNLPALQPTNILQRPESGRWENQTASGQNKLGPSADRARIRSETYEGIAQAMAAQWGPIIYP